MSLTLHLFLPGKIIMIENKYLTGFYNGKFVYLFPNFPSFQIDTWNTLHIFQRYHLGVFMSVAMQNLLRLSIFGYVLKPEG